MHVHLLDEYTGLLELSVRHVFQRHEDTWLSFNVTAAVMRPKPRTQLRLLVHIRATGPHNQFDLALVVNPREGRQFQDVQPLLLLSYSTPTVISCFFFCPSLHHVMLCCFSELVIHEYIVSLQGLRTVRLCNPALALLCPRNEHCRQGQRWIFLLRLGPEMFNEIQKTLRTVGCVGPSVKCEVTSVSRSPVDHMSGPSKFFAVFTRESVASSGTTLPISLSETDDTVYIINVQLTLELSKNFKLLFLSPSLKCLSFFPHLHKIVSFQFLLCVVFVKIITNRLLCGTAINILLALVLYEGAWQIKCAQEQNDNASEGSAP